MISFNELTLKLENEIKSFRKSFEDKTLTEVYNAHYQIGFYEEYFAVLTYEDALSRFSFSDELINWLYSLENTLDFIYDEWLGFDGALNYDWGEMIDFIYHLYKEECYHAKSNEIKPSLNNVILGAEARKEILAENFKFQNFDKER